MKPLYTDDEFKNATTRQKMPCMCSECGIKFFKPKNEIMCLVAGRQTRFKSQNSSRRIQFCSNKCSHLAINRQVEVQCKQCRTSLFRKRNAIRKNKSGNFFCSSSCAAKWNNAHKTKGTRISKLEIWLSKQLPELYPNLEFHFNRKDAINGELDIYIPSLKLAFELNGIFHYEPIYGSDKLASTQTNDTRKFQACIEHGIELCIIDVSTLKNFKESKAVKFIDIISDIIKTKLELRVGIEPTSPFGSLVLQTRA